MDLKNYRETVKIYNIETSADVINMFHKKFSITYLSLFYVSAQQPKYQEEK